jgi:hypothetical protein
MNISLIVELALSGLLLATIGYCAVLERMLSALRKGQDGLKDTIGSLNAAIIAAGESMRALKASAAGAAQALDERVTRARSMVDELSLLTSSGERIADRIDRGTPRSPMNGATPAVLASRLEALKPEALRNVR